MNWKEFFRPTNSKIFVAVVFLLLCPYLYNLFYIYAYKLLPDNHWGMYIIDKLEVLGYFVLPMYILFICVIYVSSCLIFYNFKLQKMLYISLFPFVIITTYIFSALLSQFIHKNAPYCYESSHFSGFIGRYGVPNMECTCLGIMIGDCKMHATCEGGTKKCIGYVKPVYIYGPRNFLLKLRCFLSLRYFQSIRYILSYPELFYGQSFNGNSILQKI